MEQSIYAQYEGIVMFQAYCFALLIKVYSHPVFIAQYCIEGSCFRGLVLRPGFEPGTTPHGDISRKFPPFSVFGLLLVCFVVLGFIFPLR